METAFRKEVGDGLVGLTKKLPDPAAVVISQGLPRIEANGLVAIGEGLAVLVHPHPGTSSG